MRRIVVPEAIRVIAHSVPNCLLLASLLGMSTVAQAQDDLRDRFKIDVGAFFITNVNTVAELATRVGPITAGTRIDFDEDLKISDRETVGRIDGYYRFTPRSRIEFSSFKVDRDGTAITPFDINFGDLMIPQGTLVNSFFDEEVIKASYGFSYYNVPKAELGISGGLHVTRIDMGITAAQAEEADTTAPLPVLGAYFRYNISPRWRFLGKTEFFFIETDDFEGSLTDLRLNVEHQTWKNAGFGFGFNRIGTSLEADDGEFRGEFENTLSGWQAYVFATFGKAKYQK